MMSDTLEVTKLAALESQAQEYLDTFKKAYWQFIDILLEIKNSSIWQETEYPTWESYLAGRWLQVMDVGQGRVRQIQAAYPTYQMIRDVTGYELNENQIRVLKSIIPEDKRYLLSEVVSRTHSFTSAPAKRHYLATYNVLLEREKTATVTIDGDSVSVDVVQTAIGEAIVEADKRVIAHITGNSKYEIVNRFEFSSAYDARQAFNQLQELQALDNDMVITVQVKRLKIVTPVTESTEDSAE